MALENNRIIRVCLSCRGSGLSIDKRNLDIKANQHSKYIICEYCKGSGIDNLQYRSK